MSLDLFAKLPPQSAVVRGAAQQPAQAPKAVGAVPDGLAFVIGNEFTSVRGTTIPHPDGPVASYEVKRELVTWRALCAHCARTTLGTKTKLRDLTEDFHCDQHELDRQQRAQGDRQ